MRMILHIHNPPQELYDGLPMEEEWAEDSYWKSAGDVTWFKPRPEGTLAFTIFVHHAPTNVTLRGNGYTLYNLAVKEKE